MKKLWTTYSFTILLLVVSCFSAFLINLKSNINEEEYIKVTISSGDTIWEIAELYAYDSKLSKKQFINWVLTQNEIDNEQIYPGDQLILPIRIKDSNTELASAIGE